ncbi:MAG: 2-dehydropantoate 2-reductase [Candidatus Promineifilaceae bacterium]
MRIAVFGAGGAGGYYGGRLAQAGNPVVFIARGDHLEAIRAHGLQVESVAGDFGVQPADATDDPAEAGPVELVVLGVKSWQVPEAAEAMRPLIGRDTLVLPLQNGVEAAGQLAAALGEEHVLAGLAYIFSFLTRPGHIRHIGGPASIVFGELDGRVRRRTRRLLAVLRAAGIQAEIAPDIQAALWQKMVFVAALGGLGAVTRAPLGVLRTLPETRAMLVEAMAEIAEVARGRGVRLAAGAVQAALEVAERQPADATSSLQRDIGAGRPSELDYWTGAVVRLGTAAGVPTPLNNFFYHSLRPLELRARGELTFAG